MPGYLSTGTTVLSNLSLTGDVRTSTLSTSVLTVTGAIAFTESPTLSSGVSTSAVTAARVVAQGGMSASGLTLDLRTNSVVISMVTVANSSTMTTGQLRLVFAASGMSLVYSSGATVYTVGASAVSAAQG